MAPTEAALACVAEARERGLPRLIAFIEPGNARSEAAGAGALGFVRELAASAVVRGCRTDRWTLGLQASGAMSSTVGK